jgi:hypothetical protein
MSVSLGGVYSTTTNAARAAYDEDVKLAYQGSGVLRSCVTLKTGVQAQTHFFRKFGANVALQHTSAGLITPADTQHTKIAATLSNWRVGDYTDLFDQAESTIDERALLAQTDAKAIGRREDQLIIDVLDAASSLAGTVDEDLGGTNSPLNATKIRRAKAKLFAKQVAGADHYFLMNAAGMEGLLAETEVTSSDYQSVKALVDGSLADRACFGFKFKVIENRVEGGLPSISTNIQQCFAFDKAAVGLATAIEPKGMVDWIPERASYLSQCLYKGGAAVIDSLGVVEVQNYTDLAA